MQSCSTFSGLDFHALLLDFDANLRQNCVSLCKQYSKLPVCAMVRIRTANYLRAKSICFCVHKLSGTGSEDFLALRVSGSARLASEAAWNPAFPLTNRTASCLSARWVAWICEKTSGRCRSFLIITDKAASCLSARWVCMPNHALSCLRRCE